MIYANYEYYTGTYMGSVSEENFLRLAVRASSFLDYYTQNRAKDNAALDAVKICCCALVDKYWLIEAAQQLAATRLTAALTGDDVKSETVGGYSRTLASGGESAVAALSATDGAKKLLAATCNEYLAHTGLLYRGGGCCGCTRPTL